MFSSKFTKRLYQASVHSAKVLDKMAGAVITASAVKHVDTMFKEAHAAEDKAEDKFETAEILAAASNTANLEGMILDSKAERLLMDAENEAIEMGVSLSRWA